jgi:hypothetical protein
MQDVKANVTSAQPRANKAVLLAIGFVMLIAAGLLISTSMKSRSNASPTRVISQKALEEQYGLHVSLVAVTAAGGFVDVRLKLVDAQKAKLLLADAKNFPALSINKRIVLNAPKDEISQEIKFIDGGNLFIMYPNVANAVTPGTPVTVRFGDLSLESIVAQ